MHIHTAVCVREPITAARTTDITHILYILYARTYRHAVGNNNVPWGGGWGVRGGKRFESEVRGYVFGFEI